MGKSAPLTEEMVRILRAASEGRLRLRVDNFRWEITGESKPDSRSRKLLMSRGHLRWSRAFANDVEVGPSGERALADRQEPGI